MGASHSMYIGPYLEIPHAIQPEKTQDRLMCSTNAQHKVNEGKFCPTCGASIITLTSEPKMTLQPIDLYELTDGACYSLVWQPASFAELDSKLSIYISNTRQVGCNIPDDATGILDVNALAESAPRLIQQFAELCSDLIKQIEFEFSVKSAVKYGIVQYWS